MFKEVRKSNKKLKNFNKKNLGKIVILVIKSLDPDPQRSKMLDPDPLKIYVDLKHCPKHWFSKYIINMVNPCIVVEHKPWMWEEEETENQSRVTYTYVS